MLRPLMAALLCHWLICAHVALAADPVETDIAHQLGWGSWQQDLASLDLYAFPLTTKHRNILADKVEQLKVDFGLGVLGDIEQAISELDASSLLNDMAASPHTLGSPQNTATTNKFHDDLQLEEEILALEFTDTKVFDDPEGLHISHQRSEKLFNVILERLLLLEQQSKATKNNDKGD